MSNRSDRDERAFRHAERKGGSSLEIHSNQTTERTGTGRVWSDGNCYTVSHGMRFRNGTYVGRAKK